MKLLAVFAALVAVASAGNTWTLQDLSAAIESIHTDPTLKFYLVQALDDMMYNLISGNQVESVTVTIPASSGGTLSLNELSHLLQDPETNPAFLPYYEAALNQIMDDLFSGSPVAAATVTMPAMEIHHYTLHELSMALQNPETSPELVPFLEHALNLLMDSAFAGEQVNVAIFAVPVPASLEDVVAPGPADVEAPIHPAPVAPAAPASSPLVQIIVNVQ